MVYRTVIDPVVKHTEYALTDLGRSLIPIIEQLRAWGDGFRPRLEEILKKKDNV
ncbi:MAG: helix-turn-helix transcriptional regulator [Bacteroidales bacterium]|nr:helix-turn-helix transcriptional regulator [Bacteroidales bacterium]